MEMKAERIIKRVVIGALCVVTIPIVGVVLYMMVWLSGAMQYPCFSRVRGLHWVAQYERLIETRGEPNVRELIEREGRLDGYALHYDGVVFFVSNNFVSYLDITSEEYRLGGRESHENLIGIGSTREDVENSFERRRDNLSRWGEFPQNIYREIEEQHLRLSNAGFGWVSSRSGWRSVEFEFDENDVVVKMRLGLMF